MISFKETLNENIRIDESKKRKEYYNKDAQKKYKSLSRKNTKGTSSFEGLAMEIIIDGNIKYYVYFDYEDSPVHIIENPNLKDAEDYQDYQEAG